MMIPISLIFAQSLQSPIPIRRTVFDESQIAKQHMSKPRIEAIEERMADEVAKGNLAGCVGVVMRNGHVIWSSGIGFLNLERKTPMPSDAIFQVMSMTKPVAAVAAMILVERGQIRLHDSVSDYLPEFKGVKVRSEAGLKDPASPPRVRQLFSHSSGIGSDTPISDEDRASMTLADFVRFVAEQPLASEPGT